MDLRRVRYFLALAETLDFSAAARGLGITQPALTKSMNRLEQEVGGKLVRREGRRTHLTRFGDGMRAHFAEIDRSAREALEAARRLSVGVGATLGIGIVPSVGPRRLVELLLRFRERCPDTDLALHGVAPEALREGLLSGHLDCAFAVSDDVDEPRLRAVRLYDEPVVVVLRRGPREASDDAESPGVRGCIERPGGDVRKRVARFASVDVERVPVVAYSERDDWTGALVGRGLGISVMPRDSVVGDDLETRELDGAGRTRAIALLVPTGRIDNPVIRGFVELASEFAEAGPD